MLCNHVPKVLPIGCLHVRIVDFKRIDKSITIDKLAFSHGSWSNVQTLEFRDRTGRDHKCAFKGECFIHLPKLKELKINMSSLWFDSGVFVGLPSLKVLDMANSERFTFAELTKQLKISNSMPNLDRLILSRMGTLYSGRENNINETFVQALLPRNISYVDISRTQLKLNLTVLLQRIPTLNFLNLSYSYCHIEQCWSSYIAQKDTLHIYVLDASHTVWPKKVIQPVYGKMSFSNITVNYQDPYGNFKVSLAPIVLNVSGFISALSSVWLHNITLVLGEPLNWRVKQLVIRQNNLKYLDIDVKCQKYTMSSISSFDISDNGLQMIHPNILSCISNLEALDLSRNNLLVMLEVNPDLFEQLFTNLTKLRTINLSNNGLSKVPSRLLANNLHIEFIDISSNNLEQIYLIMGHLNNLNMLDLSSNNIKVLDETSLNSLSSLPCENAGKGHKKSKCRINVSMNPVRCSNCDAKPMITWFIKSKSVNMSLQNLTCTGEDNVTRFIDSDLDTDLQTLCDRKKVSLAVSISSGVAILGILISSVVIYRQIRINRRKRKTNRVLNMLRQGERQYEFVVFLSHSSIDEIFVEENVVNQLEENLQLMTGIERKLVCTRDQYLRPGFMVHDEIIRCMDRSSVIIAVVSNDYCCSSYCRSEFDQAHIQRKPLILMLKGHVDEELMTPQIKLLYKRDVRILWEVENGQYALKSSWENICRSILDRIQDE